MPLEIKSAAHLLALLLALAVPALAAPERGSAEFWKNDIDALTAIDATNPPPKDGVVFVGSSSIRLWKTLRADFPGHAVIQRGFGGSHLAHSLHYADRIVLPYAPRAIVVYAGENDLWDGRTAEEVAADFESLRVKVRAARPEAKLIFLSIKLSPSRVRIHDTVKRANALIAAICAKDSRCAFVDVANPMLAADGSFRPELFVGDQLHLSPTGYALWVSLLTPHLPK
jgi:lysophospholipase L1-like esterase